MNKSLGLGLACVVAVALSGCGKNAGDINSPTGSNAGPSSSVDRAEVAAAVASSPDVVDDNDYESAQVADASSAPPGSFTAIQPRRWWRNVRDVQRSFEFAFADTDSTGRPTRAEVVVNKRILGTLNIVLGDPAIASLEGGPNPADTVNVLRKPFEDHWRRRLLLHRIRINGHDEPVWKVVATSGVKVTSSDHTVEIQSLRVQSATQDTTIADPLAFIRLRGMLRAGVGELVTLTVTTNQNDDALFLLAREGRFRFVNNGDGTYTGTWRAPLVPGIRHAGVDALTHGTLFDDQLPYDAQAWILPFAVRGPADPAIEFLP